MIAHFLQFDENQVKFKYFKIFFIVRIIIIWNTRMRRAKGKCLKNKMPLAIVF